MRMPQRQRVTETQKRLPEGSRVTVLKDDGSVVETVTTSQPWQLGHGDWVVKLEGFSGGYDLSRVEPLRERASV